VGRAVGWVAGAHAARKAISNRKGTILNDKSTSRTVSLREIKIALFK
jgi:hypothetical protein